MPFDSDETILAGDGGDGPGVLRPGERLGDYRIIEELGRGGMGEVYLAEQVHLKQRYALKVLPRELSGRADFRERFEQEARTLAALKHERIVQVHYAGEDRGRFYLAMEFIEGGSLEDYLKAQGGPIDAAQGRRLEPGEVKGILTEILEGLRFAHDEGIIHRDLKPANILRMADGGIKISDFGLARVVGEEYVQTMIKKSIALSQFGDRSTQVAGASGSEAYVGTLHYMSPEVQEGRPADERSDLYAIGVMGYYFLTGRKPIGRAKAIAQLVPEAGESWDAVIDQCMELERSDRYQSVAEVLGDLEEIESGLHKKPKSKGPVWVGMAITILAGLAAGYYWGVYLPETKDTEERTAKPEIIAAEKVPLGPETLIEKESIPIATAFGSILVTSEPKGANVLLDGQLVGRTPLVLEKQPALKQYRIEVNLKGYRKHEQEFYLEAAERKYVTLVLKSKHGTLQIDGIQDELLPETVVAVDGQRHTAGKVHLENLLAGDKTVLVEHPDYLPWQGDVKISEQMVTEVRLQLEPKPGLLTVTLKKNLPFEIVANGVVLKGTDNRFPIVPNVEQVVEVRVREHLTAKRTFMFGPNQEKEWKVVQVPIPEPVEGSPWMVPYLGLKMVWIPPGTFLMGSPASESERGKDENLHEVVLTDGFWLGRYEVTQGEYEQIIGSNPSGSKGMGVRAPVEQVSWEDGMNFAKQLSEKERAAGRLPEGYVYSLPTEAQWEYAARAGTSSAFHYGNSLSSKQANFFGDYPYGGAEKGPSLDRPHSKSLSSGRFKVLRHGRTSLWLAGFGF